MLVQYSVCFASGYGLAWLVKSDKRWVFLKAILAGTLVGVVNSAINVFIMTRM